jgi:hypothetical protein
VHTVNTTSLQVPQPVFNATNYGQVQGGGGGSLLSPDPRMLKLAFNTASAGKSVALTSSYPNETYHLDFVGPAVRCGPANDSIIQNMTALFGNAQNALGSSGNVMEYFSWVEGDEQTWNASYKGAYSTLDQTDDDAARVYVMTNFAFWNVTRLVNGTTGQNLTLSNGTQSTYLEVTQVNVTECRLYNVSYGVDFRFQYPLQDRNITIKDWMHGVPAVSNSNPAFSPDSNDTEAAIISYSALMDAFGRLLVGQSATSHYGINIPMYTSYPIMDIDFTQAETIERGLEQLFQNFTLSTLADPGLIKNSSQADSIDTLVTSFPITYVYSPRDLFLAYGLSLLAAVLCTIVGFSAFLVNDASYQNAFSTYLRAASTSELRSHIDPTDTGADPLPKKLARVKTGLMGPMGLKG